MISKTKRNLQLALSTDLPLFPLTFLKAVFCFVLFFSGGGNEEKERGGLLDSFFPPSVYLDLGLGDHFTFKSF